MTTTTTAPTRPPKDAALRVRVSARAKQALLEEAARNDEPVSQTVRRLLQRAMLESMLHDQNAPTA